MKYNSRSVQMARYHEAKRAFHDRNPEAAADENEREIERLDISQQAKNHIINNRLADVVHHLHTNPAAHHNVSKMDDSSQIRAIQAIHDSEGKGRDYEQGDDGEYQTDNERTAQYLKERAGNRTGKGRGRHVGEY